MITIIPTYAALLALIGIGLGMRVSVHRGKTGISILHGDNMELALRIRRHGNFAEHVPMALLVLAFAEFLGAPASLLHVQGVALVAARILHPAGLDAQKPATVLRIAGSATTSIVTASAALFILWTALR